MARTSSPAAREAAVAAALMMAWQIAAKATRDGLFLAAYPATALPAMIGAAAVAAILMAVISAKLLRKFGPSRLIPAGFVCGALLHGAEWMLLPDYPRAVSAFLYIHVVAIGSVLLSGFWALANERFDPREARRRFGYITAAGTLGSLAGGVFAERVASLGSNEELLILLAALQLLCAAALFKFAPARPTQRVPDAPSIPQVISGAPYLIGLAAFVLLAAMSASMLDYLFKTHSVAQFGKGPVLSRFFAIFYAATSVITFGVQMGLSRAWLKRFGPGKTVATLPVVVAGASLGTLVLPGVAIIATRAIELLLRGSLYRSGYELFYTPMPPEEKRSTKSVIDIAAERMGDGLAGATIQLLLVLPAAISGSVILGLTATLSGIAAWLAFRLDRAYVSVLEKGLVNNVVKIAPEDAEDSVTRSIVLQTMSAPLRALHADVTAAIPAALPPDPVLRRLADLRSGESLRIRSALMREDPLDPVLVPQVIQLLGSDDVAHAAYAALSRVKERIGGQLVDALTDETIRFQVRKRIPKLLSSCGGRTAWEGLYRQLRNDRFEIRVRCARALERIQQAHTHNDQPDAAHQLDRNAILEIVSMELTTARKFSGAQNDQQNLMVDEVFRERTSKSMAHIFTLLGLVLPAQPVRLAFRALRTEDAKLRGVALEYLDSVLPVALREQLSAHFEGSATSAHKDARSGEALANLLDSSPSIVARLEEMGFDKKSAKAGDTHSE